MYHLTRVYPEDKQNLGKTRVSSTTKLVYHPPGSCIHPKEYPHCASVYAAHCEDYFHESNYVRISISVNCFHESNLRGFLFLQIVLMNLIGRGCLFPDNHSGMKLLRADIWSLQCQWHLLNLNNWLVNNVI